MTFARPATCAERVSRVKEAQQCRPRAPAFPGGYLQQRLLVPGGELRVRVKRVCSALSENCYDRSETCKRENIMHEREPGDLILKFASQGHMPTLGAGNASFGHFKP